MPPKKEAPMSSGEKAKLKKEKAKENKAKANPELAAANKASADAKRERRKVIFRYFDLRAIWMCQRPTEAPCPPYASSLHTHTLPQESGSTKEFK